MPDNETHGRRVDSVAIHDDAGTPRPVDGDVYIRPSAELLPAGEDPFGLAELFAWCDEQTTHTPLTMLLGRTVSRQRLSVDLSAVEHLIVGGSAGSGVTTFLNSSIVSLLLRATPTELKMIIIDPRMTYLTAFEGIPHLITPIVAQPRKAANALTWLTEDMHRRHADMQTANAAHIDEFNTMATSLGCQTFPYVVVIISELADLMMSAPTEVEDAIVQLGHHGACAGIHLFIATHWPSAGVLDGPMKASIPSRVSFATRSLVDSNAILGRAGAQELPGTGGGLFLANGAADPAWFLAVQVSEEETRAVVAFTKSQATPEYLGNVTVRPPVHEPIDPEIGDDTDLFLRAVEIVVSAQSASTSLLQRRLRVGSATATRLMELLEARQIFGACEGTKPHKVLVSREELTVFLDALERR